MKFSHPTPENQEWKHSLPKTYSSTRRQATRALTDLEKILAKFGFNLEKSLNTPLNTGLSRHIKR